MQSDEIETRRGYSTPLPANRKQRLISLAVGAGVLALAYLLPYLPGEFFAEDSTEQMALRLSTPFILPIILWELMVCLAKLHFVPEGIAITLGKWTVRRKPVNEIVLLAGVRYHWKNNTTDYIAVCGMGMEELAELQADKTPAIFQNSRSRAGWTEDMAGKYLNKKVHSAFGHVTGSILWIEWSAERLAMLRKLYPNTQWLDCTDKKIFDSQLTN